MIIVKLIGGLGNQMFQYAAGRALSHRLGVALKLDKTAFATYDLHAYAIDNFNIHEQFAAPADLDRVARFQGWKRRAWNAAVACLTLGTVRPIQYVSENGHGFNDAVSGLTDDTYLAGYWQTERYFKDIESVIRQDFSQATPRDDLNERCLRRIEATDHPVSLHVRRADYVTDPTAATTHGACSPGYYRRCIDLIRQAVGTPHLFVFSDDIDWTRTALSFDCPATFVDHNGPERNYEDLALMSRCHHHIIANSTFSWWGAWLNPRPDKLVCAPDPFFAAADRDDSDIIPASWTRVPRQP